jgi:anthranilate synthase/phosphoribosyltransferase
MKVLIIDNIDSFVYNLYQYVGELGVDVEVKRNHITVDEVRKMGPDRIIISPGPGVPEDAGNSIAIIREFGGDIPILGVCLGHQAIGCAYGAVVDRAPTLLHGKTSVINHDGKGVFQGVLGPLVGTRYHSLAILPDTVPNDLVVTATCDDDGVIMGIRHKKHPVEGVQFHPESILTREGRTLVFNFLRQNEGEKMKEYIGKLVIGEDLTEEEAESAMKSIMSGMASPAQVGSFLTALRMKGETVEEVAACAKIMRQFASNIDPNVDAELLDTCGTGGDAVKTFNISTIATFVVAGAGVPIAKHGNRSVTSKAGSADILEALGVKIDLAPEKVEECIEDEGIGFMFAPVFHKAMKNVIGPRTEMGIRTVFNILGPLTNPAGAPNQVLGVFDADLTDVMAGVLKELGSRRALVVHGMEGLDEMSLVGETRVSELKDGQVSTYMVTPEDFGLDRAAIEDLSGGDAEHNAGLAMRILKGEEKGPKRDIILLNAAAGIYVAGLSDSMKDAVSKARESIDSGAAIAKLEALKEATNG